MTNNRYTTKCVNLSIDPVGCKSTMHGVGLGYTAMHESPTFTGHHKTVFVVLI